MLLFDSCLENFPAGSDHMHLFVWKMWIPLLKLVHPYDRELFNVVYHLASIPFTKHSKFAYGIFIPHLTAFLPVLRQAASLFLNVVIETNSWEVLEVTMVPLLLRSIGLSMGMVQSEKFAIYKWSENSIYKGSVHNKLIPKSFEDFHDKSKQKYMSEDHFVCSSYDLPLPISCNILSLALEAALRCKYEGVACELTLANGSLANSVVGNMLWDLSSLTLQMLLENLEHRSIAIRFLLPFLFKAFAREDTFQVAVPGMSHVLSRHVNLFPVKQ